MDTGSVKEPIRVTDLPMWRMAKVEPRGGTATGSARRLRTSLLQPVLGREIKVRRRPEVD